MTEEEAQTKWCPFANVIESGKQGTTRARNRVVQLSDGGELPVLLADNLAGARCIGAYCMAWRTAYREVRESEMPPGPRDASVVPVVETGGYCGLAGRP